MGMIKVRVMDKQQAKNLKGKTNGEKLKNMTEADIKKAIKDDPDARELTDYELNQFRSFIFLKKKLRI